MGKWAIQFLSEAGDKLILIMIIPLPLSEMLFFRKKKKTCKMLCKHDDIHLLFEGHETKAMLNNNGPRYKRSKIERRMNMDIFLCVGLLFIMCLVGSIGMKR